MKFILMLSLPCLLLSTSLFTHVEISKGEAKTISALRLTGPLVEAYRSINIAAFTVDNKGILRPQRGYSMHLIEDDGKIIVKPFDWSNEISAYDGYEKVPLPNGAGFAHCMCEEGKDNCHFEKTDEIGPDRDDYACTGTCGCSLYIVIDRHKNIPEYETPGGRWFNF